MSAKKYKIRIVRGAFLKPSKLDELNAKTIEKLDRSKWKSIDEIEVNLKQIKELQKNMTRHYNNAGVPWRMDGYCVGNKNDVIVALGADDGEGGKIFQFSRNDKKAISDAMKYGISKGIPKEQLDFMDIDF